MSVNEFTYGPLVLDEMMKIVSLLENPPEAAPVRKALRFYEIPPTITKYDWGRVQDLMDMLHHYALPQSKDELAWMLEFVRGKNSLLEVGSNFGGTLKHMASVMNKGARIVSVDWPVDATPKFLNPLESLKDTCRKLSLMGANVELFVGDSHSQAIVEAVRAQGPFDFCFIDGDHSYEGVKQDWENYGPMAKMVAFHDIAWQVQPVDEGSLGCRRFWHELKAEGKYKTAEYVARESPMFGIGVVFRED